MGAGRNDHSAARERGFHDRWAEGIEPGTVSVEAAFEAVTAQENRFIMEILGALGDRKLLDVGAGTGESPVYFAMKGAKVTAVDVSPKMIAVCEESARRHGVEINTVVSSLEAFEPEEEAFDVVYAANVLHHVADRDSFFRKARRALKTGGLFVAWDPLRYNPFINVYRRLAADVRTEDERPLGVSDLRLARRYFPDLRHREFWLTTLTLFFKYFLIDRKDPGKVRYWKAMLAETREGIGWWFLPLKALDDLLLRLPVLRFMAWNVVQWGTKSGDIPPGTGGSRTRFSLSAGDSCDFPG
ncbi:MAG: methyltransferase domain-containing protein [bacterium]